MGSNVLALEPVRNLHHDGKPDRAEVEAAVRTIIRWSGDNPDREGLIETPARVTRAFEEAFVGTRRRFFKSPLTRLRASHGTDPGKGVGRLHAEWPRGLH